MTISSSKTISKTMSSFNGGGGDTKTSHQKTSPTKPSNTVKKNSTGIQIKRKPSIIPSKKGKKSTKPSSTVTVSTFDLEATICPICDEACTCPKTTTVNPTVKTTINNNNNSKTSKTSKSSTSKNIQKKTKKTTTVSKPKYLNKQPIEEEDDYEEDYDGDESEEIVEDPALSFIRMIYSDEESLDEEEAYALYQATQLFSSSEEEEEEEEIIEGDEDNSDYYNSDSEMGSDYDNDSSDNEYEYTVVEYVQPRKKKPTEFVAYESGTDNEDDENDSSEEGNLLLNAEISETESFESEDSCTPSDDNNWLTYTVFDIDRDIILTQQQSNQSQQQFVTSLSSHGSGTPETLLFSTSSTDKIPNIAPQVLAAISAAAKHMANTGNNNRNSNNTNSKYFSYITLNNGGGEDVNGEEFLFFEEPEPEPETTGISDNCEDSELEEYDSEIDMEVDLHDDEEEEDVIDEVDSDTFSEIEQLTAKKLQISKPVTNIAPLPLNRWNRVPIGAFRRSRRPSIPNHFHHIHPSAALKTFTDPTAAALTLFAPLNNNNTTNNNGEDSFDESAHVTDRAHSVVTWDELDMDIVNNPLNTTATGSSPPPHNIWPLPKRSRSVMAPLSNNYEWLNNNWNWEM